MNKVFYFKSRILQFKKPNCLISDEDIMNLFVGLVKLIKKNTQLELEEKYLHQINKLQEQIKRHNIT